MACANFGFLNNFDHSLQTWKTWKCRLTQWFIANDIDAKSDPAGVKRRAVLLSALSEATYKLVSDLALPKELQEVPFEDIVLLIDGHFTPKTTGFSERHTFYAAVQLPTESASQWAARLRGLTASCQFSNVEEALRDRFVMGMLPGIEKEKLYMQDLAGLTLAKAVEMVDNLRSARAAATSAGHGGTVVASSPSDQLFKIGKNDKAKCYVCGYTNHKAKECRFASYTCKKCNVKGHLRRMCKNVKYVGTDEVHECNDDDDNLSCFTHGCSTGWVSGVLGNEALTGGAWLAALPCLVALPAAPFFAVLADARGRKAGAFCICVSFIISWSLAAWCGHRGVWAARVAAGAGGAGALALAPLYCAEIAPRTRGLAAMPALACSCGILFAYAAGGVLSAHALSLTMAAPPAILLVSLFWLPETPAFLISVGRIQDAAKIMCWFEGSDFREDVTDVVEQQEVKIRTSDCYGRREPMRRQDSDTFQPMLKRSSGLDSNSEKKNEQSACKELFRHRRSRRALISCVVVLSAAAGSGAGAVNSFAAAVLRHSSHSVPHLNMTAYNFTINNGTVPRQLFESSEAGSLFCGGALVLGAAFATVTVDKIGRKKLLLWSCSGITCCLAILGIYCDPGIHIHTWYSHRTWPQRRTHNFREKDIQLTENITDIVIPEWKVSEIPEWKNFSEVKLENESYPEFRVHNILNKTQNVMNEESLFAPVALMSVVLFFYNIGLGSIPYVLISEWFSLNVRTLASSLLISWMWLSNFLVLRYYGSLAILIGLHGTYYICASITLMGSLYTFFVISETKGKSQEQINDDLDGPLFVLTRRRKNER